MTHAHTIVDPSTPSLPTETVRPPRRSRAYLHARAAVEQARHFRARLDSEQHQAQALGAVAVQDTAASHAEARVQAEARMTVVLWDSPVSVALALRDALIFQEVSALAAEVADRVTVRFAQWGVQIDTATGTVAWGARP